MSVPQNKHRHPRRRALPKHKHPFAEELKRAAVVIPNGTALSRSTYAALFDAITKIMR